MTLQFSPDSALLHGISSIVSSTSVSTPETLSIIDTSEVGPDLAVTADGSQHKGSSLKKLCANNS